MRTVTVALTFVMMLLAGDVSAGVAQISGTGTWGAGAPTTDFSAPDSTWSFWVDVNNPLDGISSTDRIDLVPILQGVFYLNGVAVGVTPTTMTFYDVSSNGLFDMLFDGSSDFFSAYGPVLFDNTTDKNLIYGTVSSAPVDVNANGYNSGGLGTGSFTTSAVPEIDPAGMGSVLALVTGALGLLERRRLRVKLAA